ncbi:MAG: hypothetical protein ABIK44_01520 [candidate division WOR-3 bacterium]
MRSQRPVFAAASAVLTVLVLVSLSFAELANHKPCLCRPEITPMHGTARTTYVASVRYSDPDGDAPAKVEVYVDDIPYPMRRVSGRAADGIYRARLTLPPGEHRYYFYAEDSRGLSERFPRYGAKPGPYVGTNRLYNRLPILTEGGVHFSEGTDASVYTFTVHYRDPDGTKPKAVRVIIDGIIHDMTLHAGEPADGIYMFQTRLPARPHRYHFVGIDDCGACATHPRHGFLRGPEVTSGANRPPVLGFEKVDPPTGGPGLVYTYYVEYHDPDSDAPSLPLIYINNTPHRMKPLCGKPGATTYVYRTKCCLGSGHKYYFYFEDGRGGTCRYPAVGSFHGPVVTR